jgi:hypothetical protein
MESTLTVANNHHGSYLINTILQADSKPFSISFEQMYKVVLKKKSNTKDQLLKLWNKISSDIGITQINLNLTLTEKNNTALVVKNGFKMLYEIVSKVPSVYLNEQTSPLARWTVPRFSSVESKTYFKSIVNPLFAKIHYYDTLCQPLNNLSSCEVLPNTYNSYETCTFNFHLVSDNLFSLHLNEKDTNDNATENSTESKEKRILTFPTIDVKKQWWNQIIVPQLKQQQFEYPPLNKQVGRRLQPLYFPPVESTPAFPTFCTFFRANHLDAWDLISALQFRMLRFDLTSENPHTEKEKARQNYLNLFPTCLFTDLIGLVTGYLTNDLNCLLAR